MSNQDFNEAVIIRKRRSDGEEEHHGGVWKLAFADFMTAMMAFFLVMWLINSTSKETKAAIVQYFNPVNLINASPSRKGLRDPKENGQGASMQQANEAKEANATSEEETKQEKTEAALHSEPQKALDEIAKRDAAPARALISKPSASDELADPFDRMTESQEEAEIKPPASQIETTPNRKGKSQESSKKTTKADTPSPEAIALREAVDQALRAEARGLQNLPTVELRQVDNGVIINLSDDPNFSMFEVGSIQPKPQLVRLLTQIGKALTKLPGEIEIAGHTDGRSFKARAYDNWRLSSDRANMVNHMLTRGGLPAARIAKIIGYADKRLKTPKDPLAANNRRIEIFLRSGS